MGRPGNCPLPIVGIRIRWQRQEKGWTQLELGRRIGVLDRQTVYAYEAGQCFPCIAHLIGIADALGCSTDFLLGRTDESPTATKGTP